MVLALGWRADPWRSALAFLLSVSEAVGAAALAYGLKLVTDAAVRGDGDAVVTGALVLVGLGGAAAAGNWAGFMVATRLREETELAVDLRLLDLMMGVPGLEHLERPEYADEVLLLRSQRGALAGLPKAAALNLGFAVQAVIVLSLLAAVHPMLLALPLFGVPSLVLATRGETLVQNGHEETAEGWRLRAHLFDLATGAAPAKEMRLFSLGDELLHRHEAVCRDIDRCMVRAELRAALWAAAGAVAFTAGFVGAVAFVAWLAVEGRASAGDVVLAVGLATHVNREVGGAVASVGWLARAVRVARRYAWLVDHAHAAAEAVHRDDPVPVPAEMSAGIDLVSVGFRYPGTDTDILDGVDLHIPAGSTVAIVGDNGAGKTTLVKLLARLYEPTSGRILVDGVDLARFDVAEWRECLAAGFQDYVRYEVVAREAVGVGSVASVADDARVRAALASASAADVVDALPRGLDTQLGLSFDGGTELSGGQWQKLALGRAMMRRRPLLLLLDEPTAALDAQTEYALFERYAGAAREVAARTGAVTVLVSHRFSTVRMADLIVVLDGGRVVEAGSHADLMARSGLYAELYELQARAYR